MRGWSVLLTGRSVCLPELPTGSLLLLSWRKFQLKTLIDAVEKNDRAVVAAIHDGASAQRDDDDDNVEFTGIAADRAN